MTRTVGRARRIADALVAGWAAQLLILVVGLALTPFFLARVGNQGYGLWLVGTQVLGYLALLDLGVVASLPRSTAWALGQGGSTLDGVAAELGRTLRVVLWQWPLVAVAALGLYVLLPEDWAELAPVLAWVLGFFVLLYPARVLQALLQGLQDLRYLTATQVCTWALGTGVCVVLLLRGAGLRALAAGWVVTQAGAVLSLAARVAWRFPGAWPRTLPRLGRGELLARVRGSAWVSLSQVATVLVHGVDMVVLARVLGPAAVVPYAVTAKLVQVFAQQPTLVLASAQPALAELRGTGDTPRLRRAVQAVAQATLLVSGLLACGVLGGNAAFVAWWVGPERHGGFTLEVLLVLAMLVRHLHQTVSFTLFACGGHDRRLALTSLAEGAVVAAGTAVGAHVLGVQAVPLAALAALTLVSLPLNLRALGRALAQPAWAPVAQLARWAGHALPVAVGASLLSSSGALPSGPTGVVLGGGAAGLAYVATQWTLVRREPLATYVLPRLRRVWPWGRQVV